MVPLPIARRANYLMKLPATPQDGTSAMVPADKPARLTPSFSYSAPYSSRAVTGSIAMIGGDRPSVSSLSTNSQVRCVLRASGGTTLYLILPTGLKKYQKQDIVNAYIFIPRIAPNVNIPASAILFSSPAGIHGVEPYVNCRLSGIVARTSTIPFKRSHRSGSSLTPSTIGGSFKKNGIPTAR